MTPASLATASARRASAGGMDAPHPVTTVLAVENMHCGGCMRKVETALAAVPGIATARVNLSARRVTAVHDAAGVNAADLVEALARAGFRAAELAAETAEPTKPVDRELLKRLGVAGFAAANIMLLSVSVWSGGAGDMTPSVQALFHWLSALIALPTVAYAGQPFFRSAAQALRARRLNMDVPISLGVTLATAMSLYQTTRGSQQVYFDAAVTLLFFLLVGRYLDQRMRARAAGAAANLMGLRGTAATIIRSDGTTERLGARLLEPGMRILTAAGERFAVDGRVLDGRGEVDESLITGETAPRTVAPGAQIYAGTVNLSGSLVTEATATDQNTLLAEIARLMSAAEQARGRYVRLADRAARFYAPAVHILGLVTFLGWLLAGHGWEAALTAAIAVLIITCPCALALAVPAVQVAATGRLFGKGVLVKAADGLERHGRDRHGRVRQDRYAHAGRAGIGHQRQRYRCRADARGEPRGGEPASLCARRGARGRGRRSRGRACLRRARGRGVRARAYRTGWRRTAGLSGVVRRGRAGARCGSRVVSVRRRHRDGPPLRGPIAVRCRRRRPAPARGRLPHGAAVGRQACGGGNGGHPIGHRPLDGRRAAGAEDRPHRGVESRLGARC